MVELVTGKIKAAMPMLCSSNIVGLHKYWLDLPSNNSIKPMPLRGTAYFRR